jgi:hypothetical protein
MKRIKVLVIGVLALVPVMAYSAGARGEAAADTAAEMDCRIVVGRAATRLDPATGTFVGAAHLRLDGVLRRVPVETRVLRQSVRDGVIYAVTSHSLQFRTGTVTTVDQARLIPLRAPGVYRLLTLAHIREGGRGFLVLHATVEFVGTPTAKARVVGGQLCR